MCLLGSNHSHLSGFFLLLSVTYLLFEFLKVSIYFSLLISTNWFIKCTMEESYGKTSIKHCLQSLRKSVLLILFRTIESKPISSVPLLWSLHSYLPNGLLVCVIWPFKIQKSHFAIAVLKNFLPSLPRGS